MFIHVHPCSSIFPPFSLQFSSKFIQILPFSQHFVQVDLNLSPDPPALRGVTDLAPEPEGRDACGAAPGGAGRETQLRLEALRPVAGDDDSDGKWAGDRWFFGWLPRFFSPENGRVNSSPMVVEHGKF